MDATYWIKQEPSKPTFESIEWTKPQNKRLAKKIIIIGGSSHGFTQVAHSYSYCEKARIGDIKVILPESATKHLKQEIPIALEGVATNQSGGFSRKALNQLVAYADASDGVLLAGDFDRNSETAITMQDFMKQYVGPVIATKDVINYFITDPEVITKRQNTTLVLNFAQLQKLAKTLKFEPTFLFEDNLQTLVSNLHHFTATFPLSIIVLHHKNMIVALDGMVSTTLQRENITEEQLWQTKTAAIAAVYYLQHTKQPFEALTTAVTFADE